MSFCTGRFALLLHLGILCAALAGQAWSQPPPPTAQVEKLWQKASEAQQANQYDVAVTLYKQILVLQPDLLEAEVNLGLMYQLRGDLQSAIGVFKQVLKRSPDLYPPNLLLGLDDLKLGKPDEARPYLDKAVILQPSDPKAQVGFANNNLQLHHYQAAREHFQRAIALDRNNAEA